MVLESIYFMFCVLQHVFNIYANCQRKVLHQPWHKRILELIYSLEVQSPSGYSYMLSHQWDNK